MRFGTVLLLGCLLGAGSAFADPAPEGEPAGDAEVYEELLSSFDEALRVASEEAADEVDLLEAEEIVAIAEELSAEGENAVALSLLEEAIALLPTPEGE